MIIILRTLKHFKAQYLGDPMEHNYKTLFSQEALAKQVTKLGQQISQDYQGKQIIVVGVLKGSFIFVADLIREMTCSLSVEFIGVSSYKGTKSTGHVKITQDLTHDIKGKHILLVEDIVDTGRTLDYLIELLKVREPASLKVCSLLSKPHKHDMKNKVDYVGFNIQDQFVIGYGLDLDGNYRQIPYVAEFTR